MTRAQTSGAVAVGVLFAVVSTLSAVGQPTEQLVRLAVRLLFGFFLAASLGGSVLNFLRGYREGSV